MNRRPPSGIFDDVSRFAFIAERIVRDRASLREIAKDLGISNSAIHDCVARLQSAWNCTLLTTRQGASDSNQLTPEAMAFYEQFSHILRNGGSERTTINVNIAHSLLTSQLLGPAIAGFLADADSDYRQRLRIHTRLDFASVIKELQLGSLEVAIFWGLPSLNAAVPRGVACMPTCLEFDLVAVSHSAQVLDNYIVDGELSTEAFRRLNFATISRERQPLPLSVPADWMYLGQTTEVDTFDAVMALVRSRVADFGCIPAVYPDLDRHRVADSLHWKKLNCEPRLRVCIYTRQGGKRNLSHDALRLVEKLESYLQEVSASGIANPAEISVSGPFPRDPAWFESMRFGYFLDFDREGPGPVKWYWETLLLQRTADGFQGIIRNCKDVVFSIVSSALLDNIFYVAARQLHNKKTNKGVDSFVSLFLGCIQEDGIMSGYWGGVDTAGRPMAYGTIWSHEPLSIEKLTSIASKTAMTFVLNSAQSVAMTEQPSSIKALIGMKQLLDAIQPSGGWK